MADKKIPAKNQDGFFVIQPTNEGKYDTFRILAEVGTKDLYNINAADKAQAVPFIRIWKLKSPRSNETYKTPLSDQFYTSPDFGQSVAFAERPFASITSLRVKKHNPGGWILFREIDVEITVHRPDALISKSNPQEGVQSEENVLGSLLQPGSNFYLEYGWKGGQNGILGTGNSNKEWDDELLSAETEVKKAWLKRKSEIENLTGATIADVPKEPEFYGKRYDAVSAIRFAVTHYNFSLQPDGQVKFNIHGIEDGELQVRDSNIFDQYAPPSGSKMSEKDVLNYIADNIVKNLTDNSVKVDKIEIEPADKSKPAKFGTADMVPFDRVLDVLIAKPLRQSVEAVGYNHVHLYTGVLNQYSPVTSPRLGSQVTANLPLGALLLRLDDLKKLVNTVVVTNQQMTVQNILQKLFGLVMDRGNWTNATTKDYIPMHPEIQLFTIFSPSVAEGSGYARFQIVDRKRYLTVLKGTDKNPEQNYKAWLQRNREQVENITKSNHMPFWSLYHRNSFFKDAKFEVVADEQMKSIFIQRGITPIRAGPQGDKSDKVTLPMGLLLYRSAVKGTVTTIGNFVFDLLGQVWMNFGVPALDGIFYVLGKVDTVNSSGFYSEITLQSEGSNPLGSPAPKVGDAKSIATRIKESNEGTAQGKQLTQPPQPQTPAQDSKAGAAGDAATPVEAPVDPTFAG